MKYRSEHHVYVDRMKNTIYREERKGKEMQK